MLWCRRLVVRIEGSAMKIEPSQFRLLTEILWCLYFVVLGALIIRTTKTGTNVLLNPPAWLRPWMTKSTFGLLLGRRGEIFFYYLIGFLFVVVASILIIQRLLILARRLGYL